MAGEEKTEKATPLGIWSANSKRCDKILHPILDLMQTMPAFVYLIPAVLFFGLGTVPGAFATIIFAEYGFGNVPDAKMTIHKFSDLLNL